MKPTDLRGILQYIPQFREKTFILAIDGDIVATTTSRRCCSTSRCCAR